MNNGCSRFAVGTPSRGISQRLTSVSTRISTRFAAARKSPKKRASASASEKERTKISE